MARRSWILFSLLAAFWGASYLFIEVALEDGVGPAAIVFARTALAALVLLPIALHRGALAGIGTRLGAVALLALMQIAAPFMLITVGQQELTSSMTGILVATAPIFTFLLAFTLAGEERASSIGLVGVGIGMAGVALLLGLDAGGGAGALAGGLLVVLASFGYAIGAWYLKRRLPGLQPVGLVTAATAASALMVAPLAALDVPAEVPGIDALGALATLGAVGTGIAFVIFHSLIVSEGPAKASLVAYVAPGFSVLYGVTLLGESFSIATAGGLLLILGGSWLAAERRSPWRERRVGEPRAEPAVDAAAVNPAGADPAAGDPAQSGSSARPAEATA